ncbi:AIR synthase related protein [Nonomuraea sp. NPDC005650]|uniref:AIR synthase related protein n=1 Tax=Nonomuraea sp. NPDC005650 TaxID=3157045 RepID=UPI0033A123F8
MKTVQEKELRVVFLRWHDCGARPGETMLAWVGHTSKDPLGELVVGTDAGDDAAVVRIQGDVAVVSTADYFIPMVDNPYDWGRIAAANAVGRLYDGGRSLVGLNLLVCRSNIEIRGLSCG